MLENLTLLYLNPLFCEQISWESRLHAESIGPCFASLDGTDCRVREPSPFGPKWFSHKFKGPGLRYEVAVSIRKGHIVWVNGTFP